MNKNLKFAVGTLAFVLNISPSMSMGAIPNFDETAKWFSTNNIKEITNTNNFEFAILGQAGLQLIVTGYAQDGSQMFSEIVSSPEKRADGTTYVIRVDEAILLKNQLAEWCVEDSKGIWNQLPKGKANVKLCDNRPFETRGSFKFESRSNRPIEVAQANQNSITDDTFNFKIGKNVPEFQVKTIVDGFAIAQAHLNKFYGGAIDPKSQKRIRVRIEASGKGEKNEGEGAPAAMSWTTKGPNLYFDVIHPQWNQGDGEFGWSGDLKNKKSTIHEYVHAWQGVLTTKGLNSGKWIDEGIAEYIAFDAMVGAGQMKQGDADAYLITTAKNSDGTTRPLKSYLNSSVWPGEIGAVAINWLVAEAPKGKMSLRIFATNIAAGMSTKAAFADAFDIELDEFYKQFELYRKIINANPIELAIKSRPYLTNLHEAGGMSDQYEFNIIIDKTANFEVMALDGKNKPVWKSGPMGAKTNLFAVKMSKVKVKNATKYCVFLAKGWIVRDQAGKAYSASCDDIGSLSLRSFGYELKVEKQ